MLGLYRQKQLCLYLTNNFQYSRYRVTAPKISDTEEVEIVNIVGDGTVPLNSLRYCEKFQSANVVIQNFQGYEHTGVLYETVFHDYVMSVAKGAQSFP